MSTDTKRASVAHIQPYPLLWPERLPKTKFRSSSAFRVSLAVAIKELKDELARFVSSYIITSNVTGLAADLIGNDPGVAIWFVRKNQVQCIACDQYPTVRENLRALTLCIEALRQMERHSTQIVDAMMASPSNAPRLPRNAGDGREPWWMVLGVAEDAQLDAIEAVYRTLSKSAHPDQEGGSQEAMSRLNNAIADARKARGGLVREFDERPIP